MSYVQIHDTEYGKTYHKSFSWLGATTLLQLDVQLIVSKDSMKRFCQYWKIKKTAEDDCLSFFEQLLNNYSYFNQNVYVFKPRMMPRVQVFDKIIRLDLLPLVWSLKIHQQNVYQIYFGFRRFEESCVIPFFSKNCEKK